LDKATLQSASTFEVELVGSRGLYISHIPDLLESSSPTTSTGLLTTVNPNISIYHFIA